VKVLFAECVSMATPPGTGALLHESQGGSAGGDKLCMQSKTELQLQPINADWTVGVAVQHVLQISKLMFCSISNTNSLFMLLISLTLMAR
jgi:hypothetical protein